MAIASETTPDIKVGPGITGQFLGGLGIIAFSIFFTIEALRMPLPGPGGFMAAPGFVPLLTGLVTLLLSLVLTVSAMRRGGHRHIRQWLREIIGDPENKRLLWIVLAVALYAALLGHVPFTVATMIFHVLIFAYLGVHLLPLVLYSLFATFLVAYLLPTLFNMPTP